MAAKRSNQLAGLADPQALDLGKVLSEKELASLSKFVNEVQRDDYTICARDVVKAIFRDFMRSAEARDSRENAIIIRRALYVATGGITT